MVNELGKEVGLQVVSDEEVEDPPGGHGTWRRSTTMPKISIGTNYAAGRRITYNGACYLFMSEKYGDYQCTNVIVQ